MDLACIQTRTTAKGVVRYRAYTKVKQCKLWGPWGTYEEAIAWRKTALLNPPEPRPRKRRPGQRKPRKIDGFVYVIQAGTDGPVKVGWTGDDPAARVRALQSGNHVELRLLGYKPGTHAQEYALHQLLDTYRIRGEWFDIPWDTLSDAMGPMIDPAVV